MVETARTDGIKLVPYPNLETGKNETLYVCTRCRPQWDTFDEAAAKAHVSTGVHNPELLKAR